MIELPPPVEFRIRLDEDARQTAERWAAELTAYVAELVEWARRSVEELADRLDYVGE